MDDKRPTTEDKYIAGVFMESVFNKIKHGDDKHQEWLKGACAAEADRLAHILRLTADTAVDDYIENLNAGLCNL